jgi:hypothetical protein
MVARALDQSGASLIDAKSMGVIHADGITVQGYLGLLIPDWLADSSVTKFHVNGLKKLLDPGQTRSATQPKAFLLHASSYVEFA